MAKSSSFKIVVTVPASHADQLREAVGKAGGGKIGNYAYCSYSTQGTGRFLPLTGASPFLGMQHQLEEVEEEKIEISCSSPLLRQVVAAIKETHPYEEPVIDVYALYTELS